MATSTVKKASKKASSKNSEILIYLNGEFVPKSKAMISVFDHGFLYGDGVFEGIRSYNGRVFRLDQHLKRFYDSARTICLDMGMTPKEMEKVVVDTVRVNNLQDSYIRLVASRGPGDLGLAPWKCSKATIVCIADKISLYPDELYKNGLKIVTVPTRRNIPEGVNPNIKSLNYLNNIMAKIEARISGCDEALLLNQQGYVAECTGDNIFVVRNGELLTPPAFIGTLDGITKQTVEEIARKLKIPTREATMTRFDVYNAEECFLTGTAAEIIPVVDVDTRTIGSGKPGKITMRLIAEYHKYTKTTGTPVFKK